MKFTRAELCEKVGGDKKSVIPTVIGATVLYSRGYNQLHSAIFCS